MLRSLPKKWVAQGTSIYESQMYIEVSGFIQSGKLQSSIRSEVFDDHGEVSTNSGYGKAVDEGRRALDIYPRIAKVLRFFINGRIVFAMESHPGPAKGHHFTKSTLFNARPRIISMIQDVYITEAAKIK